MGSPLARLLSKHGRSWLSALKVSETDERLVSLSETIFDFILSHWFSQKLG